MEQSPEDTIYSEIPDIPISGSKVILQLFLKLFLTIRIYYLSSYSIFSSIEKSKKFAICTFTQESLTESKSSEEIIQQPLENYLEKNAEAFEDAVKNQNPMEIFNVELEQTVDQDQKSDAVNEETADAGK